MIFSSPLFLFVFLPIVLITQLLVMKANITLRNSLLLIASLLFYSFGEPFYIILMCASIGMNHLFGRWISINEAVSKNTSLPLTLGVICNLGNLAIFKYGGFFVENLNEILLLSGTTHIPVPAIALPLGISFYTFQSISYLIDVARKRSTASERLIDTALYISLFPQLIAGPIVRYHEIAAEIRSREITLDRFDYGIKRFVIGLGKKVLIANTLAHYVDYAFALPEAHLTSEIAWFATLGYALQIYYDFSGYSDMAIGLGAMLGFTFPENFNYPYAAKSIREFWQRWHMTLSHWFRDYLYIPLGGSHAGSVKTHRNLLIVFFLCGLWHGAAWNFVAWGLIHGLFLILERGTLGRLLNQAPRLIAHFYTLAVVIFAWIPFRADSLEQSLLFFQRLLGFGIASPDRMYALILTHEFIFILSLGILLSFPFFSFEKESNVNKTGIFPALCSTAGVLLLLILSSSKLASGTYNPFIYFRF